MILEVIYGIGIAIALIFIVVVFGATIIDVTNVSLTTLSLTCLSFAVVVIYYMSKFKPKEDNDVFLEIEERILKGSVIAPIEISEERKLNVLVKIKDQEQDNIYVIMNGRYDRMFIIDNLYENVIIGAASYIISSKPIENFEDFKEFFKEKDSMKIVRYALFDSLYI